MLFVQTEINQQNDFLRNFSVTLLSILEILKSISDNKQDDFANVIVKTTLQLYLNVSMLIYKLCMT